MKKETFDFSEALRRMKEGKIVKRQNSSLSYGLNGCDIFLHGRISSIETTTMLSQDILATDWEEMEG